MSDYHIVYRKERYMGDTSIKHEVVASYETLLEIVKKAREEEYSHYYDLIVFFGDIVEFEPYEKVVSYRIKDQPS